MSKYFTKINSPYKRDPKGKAFIPEFADPVFEENLHSDWKWYYKWDGTSVGFEWGGEPFGRTKDSALSWEQWKAVLSWQEFEQGFTLLDDIKYVYGELVGPGIQGNPHGLEELEVITFASRDATSYHLDSDNLWWGCSLQEAINEFRVNRAGLKQEAQGYFEGLVGHLAADPNVITKLKVKDRWSW